MSLLEEDPCCQGTLGSPSLLHHGLCLSSPLNARVVSLNLPRHLSAMGTVSRMSLLAAPLHEQPDGLEMSLPMTGELHWIISEGPFQPKPFCDL